MDAGIILQGQTPNILGAMEAGRAAAENQINLTRQNQIAELYRTQGAQIAAGDPNALAALAGFDPNASLGVQQNVGLDQTRLGMAQTKQQMAALDEKTKREASDYAKQVGAEAAAAEAAKIEAGVKQALMAPDATTFDALMVQIGQPDMVGQFENRDMLASQFMSVAEILKMTNPEGPEWRAATPEEATAYGAPSGQINNKTGEFKKTGEGKGISYTTKNADGSETTVQIGGSGSGAGGLGLTEAEGKATGFLYRMDESNKTLTDLEAEGSSLWNKTAGKVPVFGNYMVSEGAQKFDQAKRDFINSILRRESGAVISPEEFANAEVQYFPQPGDGPEVVAQKRKNRLIAIEGVRASAGAGGATTSGVGSGSQQGFDQAEISDALMNGP